MLEKLSEMTKSAEFQEKVQKMTQDPAFMNAAGQYAEEMKDEVIASHKQAQTADEDDIGLGLATGDVEDEELE